MDTQRSQPGPAKQIRKQTQRGPVRQAVGTQRGRLGPAKQTCIHLCLTRQREPARRAVPTVPTYVTGAHRQRGVTTSIVGALKCMQNVTFIQIGDPTAIKPCTAPVMQDPQETGSRDPTTEKRLRHHFFKPSQISGQSSTQVHHSEETVPKPRKTV